MTRLWRIIGWVLAGVVGLVLVVAAAVVIFSRTARFNDLLRARLVSYLAQTYRGEIAIGSIEGSVWGSLTLRDIEVRHGGSDIVSISQLRVGYQILPALRRTLVLSAIAVIKPELHLARDSDGRWNLLAAIAERNPSPPSPPSDITIALRRLAIEQAAVSVTTAPSATYLLSNGHLNGSGNIGPSGQSFKVDTIPLAPLSTYANSPRPTSTRSRPRPTSPATSPAPFASTGTRLICTASWRSSRETRV